MGNLLKLYQEMAVMLNTQLEWQGHRQTFHTLLSLMLGVLMSRDVRLGRIASKGFLDGNIESVEQRYRRWLKNKHIKPQVSTIQWRSNCCSVANDGDCGFRSTEPW